MYKKKILISRNSVMSHLFFIVAVIGCLLISCGESNLDSATRKHCHCGDPLVAAVQRLSAAPTDTLVLGATLNAYNEMVFCIGGEESWKDLRWGGNSDFSNKLVKKLQQECPTVLEALQRLEIYSF